MKITITIEFDLTSTLSASNKLGQHSLRKKNITSNHNIVTLITSIEKHIQRKPQPHYPKKPNHLQQSFT
jgi:hypothetical protein